MIMMVQEQDTPVIVKQMLSTRVIAHAVLAGKDIKIRLQSALWPSLPHCTVFGLKCVQMAVNDSQLGLS